MSQYARIILVDDDIYSRGILAASLDKLGGIVPYLTLDSGVALFEYLVNTPYDEMLPTLIVLDMNMPVVTGLEVMKILKEHPRYRAIPVVILSVGMSIKDKILCFDNGAIDCIDKPDDPYKNIVYKLQKYSERMSPTPHK